MTSVITSYILIADEGLKLSPQIGYVIGIVTAIVCIILFLSKAKKVTV